jgi:hypothetical protein
MNKTPITSFKNVFFDQKILRNQKGKGLMKIRSNQDYVKVHKIKFWLKF